MNPTYESLEQIGRVESYGIHPAKLAGTEDGALYSAVGYQLAKVDRAFAVCDQYHTPGEHTIIGAAHAWRTAVELQQLLNDRTGLATVPDCPPDDWYKEMAPRSAWDDSPALLKAQWIEGFRQNYQGVDPEDVALD